ncbi:MAG: pantetheine-phosphate adenylyltransferase [Armatimonadetes bacterium]|nr:pantetheine-phosphate adenylyltransferase [Armatimonadota bacterium]MBS1701436.1 pantetheine-phosphate adenylyltransferase [Armatimonadota bacterium]
MKLVAIYPGTFDPPTFGHADLIERAHALFDHVIVAVGKNSSKEPLLTIEERVSVLEEISQPYKNVTVEAFEGLLVDFAKAKGAKSIVRGLRAVADFEYEFQIAMVNRKLNPEVDSVFLMTRWEYSYLSSSVVREVAKLGGDVSVLVPGPVLPVLEMAAKRSGSKL